MSRYLCVTVRFLDGRYHGRGPRERVQWPPSPLRLFQAVVAGAALRWGEHRELETAVPALRWLERLPPPAIVAPAAKSGSLRCIYVPNNSADVELDRECYGTRTAKFVQPILVGDAPVHYLYPLPEEGCPHWDVLAASIEAMTHLGWGIDMVISQAAILSQEEADQLVGERWIPSLRGSVELTLPMEGTLSDVQRRYRQCLSRIDGKALQTPAAVRVKRQQAYRRSDEVVGRPYRVFELRQASGAFAVYPVHRVIGVAAMTRHAAIDCVSRHVVDEPYRTRLLEFASGHVQPDERQRQHRISYLPLPSIRGGGVVMGVRRVLLTCWDEDADDLMHVANLLSHVQLSSKPDTPEAEIGTPGLSPIQWDGVVDRYVRSSRVWTSVTPVILPGHAGYRSWRIEALIRMTLQHAGVEQPCQIEWDVVPWLSGAADACGAQRAARPKHLQSQTAVHVRLVFEDGVTYPGPLAIGLGRHGGLGIMAAVERLRDH